MRLVGSLEALGRDGVGKDKKFGSVASRFPQSFQEQIVLVVKHESQPFPGDVSGRFAVDLITEFHVVGRNRLCNRARCATCLEEVSGNFLAGTDLCERAVLCLVEVNRQGFPICR